MIYCSMDLETISDVEAGRRLYAFDGSDAEVAQAMAAERLAVTEGHSDFLPPGLHRIVAVGLAGLDTAKETCRIEARCSEDEPELIAFALSGLNKGPVLVTWNGGSFDLPVLRYRALLHGVAIPALYGVRGAKPWERYDWKYGERHQDLAELLSGFGASSRMRLDDVARLCGLPAKPMHGADVFTAWLEGRHEDIRGYVESDAVTVLRLMLRLELSRGRITEIELRRLEAVLEGVPA